MTRSPYLTERYVVAFAATVFAYTSLALIGLRWSVVPGAATAVWPAAGIAFAALVLGGTRLWPAIIAGRFLAAVIVESPQSWLIDLLIATGTMLGALVPAFLAKRAGGIDASLGRMRDMLWLTLGGAVGGSAISACFGVLILIAGGLPADRAGDAWLNWAAGYLVGVLTVAPLVLAWSVRSAWRMSRRTWGHLLVCLTTVAVAAYLTFFTAETAHVPAWYVYPALVWAALAFHVRGASAAVTIASMIAIASAIEGVGVLTAFAPDMLGRIFFAQQFVAVSAFTILFLAAIADERRATIRLGESQATTRLALQAGRLSSWRWNLRTGQMTAEGGSADMFGYAPGATMPAEQIVALTHPDDRRLAQRAMAASLRRRSSFHLEYRLALPDGRTEWISTHARPMYEGDGRATHIIGISQIVTERKRAEEHRQLLINELNHRVKNTLAIVQGVAQQSFRGDAATAQARQAFEGRLEALGSAHNLLTRESWESAPLRQIVEDAARPFGLQRFSLAGPDLRMSPKAAVSLALTLHELATNAAKYGALSSEGGCVQVTWSINEHDDEPILAFAWQERGGPPVAPPSRRGFGSRLIERGLAAEVGGETRVDYAAEGVSWTISAPVRKLQA